MSTITPLPTPPSSADPTNFNARADTFLTALPAFATQTNTVADEVLANANAAAASQAAAAGSATAAANSALQAAGSVLDAAAQVSLATAAAAFRGVWSAQSGALNRPAAVLHNGSYWLLLNDLANVAASEPGVSADWVVYTPTLEMRQISVNTTAAPFNHYLFTASLTLTLPAAPSVGTLIRVTDLSGANNAVVDPGAEKIRGIAGPMTLNMPGAAFSVTYSGAAYGWV